jgi:hypothetical protein
MALARLPHFKEIDLTSREIIKDFLLRYPLEASEYTFTNIFAYRYIYNFRLSLSSNNLIIIKNTEPVSAFCPVGSSQISDVLEEIFNYLKDYTSEPYLERVPESFVNAYLRDSDVFIIEEERDHFDYVYNVKELAELKGNKFHDKKNKVNKFRSLYKYEYHTLTSDLIEECVEFEDYWCQEKDCEDYPGLDKERCAILEMLRNFKSLNIKGGIIKIENKIAALTLGEKMLPDTFVIHIEKANTGFPGLYQVINQEFLRYQAGDCTFVNREQDLGIQGLRNAKMSYNPVKFVKKYKILKKTH